MATSHTLFEIRQNFCLIKYGIDRIMSSMNGMSRTDDLDQFFDATSEVLNIVSMLKLCVETSLELTAIDEKTTMTSPSPVTQRSH